MGHSYASAFHMAESIVCQSYGTKYYLMHWSDGSMTINNFALSFLGCDGFFVWGNAHAHWTRKEGNVALPIGYLFKRFVKDSLLRKQGLLGEMGVRSCSKIISFFDETFGDGTKMTPAHYINFWQAALSLADKKLDIDVLIKPKVLQRYHSLPDELKTKFLDLKAKIDKTPNIHIIDSNKWSFIEVIGVSDIVVTQGMTTSATIAIICGIQGLYLDEARYNHRFSQQFKDKLVFDLPEKLLFMVERILSGEEDPLGSIPQSLLREFDAYPDDRGIDLFRSILSGEAETINEYN
ncbi:hypothetical protein ACFL5U_00580 [Candidatus Margulisiibacteriota bacterium]